MTAARPRAAPSDERRRGGRIGALATLLLVSLGAYLALELWRANLSVPFRYAQIDDTKFYFGLVKGIIDHGWYLHNPNLAAPLGQALYDFPQGADNLNFLLIRAISLLSSNYALVTNLFFLLTFPLTGLAAHYAFRRLGVRPAAATACAVLFALLPFHFYRHESQVLLSAYYAVPLGAYLFLAVFAEEPLFPARPGAPPALAWASRRSLATLLACVVIGSAGLYYAVFAICLLLGGALVAGFAHRGRRAVLTGLAATAAIAVTVTVNLAPSLINSARHGGDPAIARTPVESEQLGLRLSNLVLPVRSHRLPLLSNLNTQYAADTSPGYCESCNETLGVVGAVGFVLLGLVALAAIAGAASSQTPDRAWRGPLRPAALGVALAFAVGTTGGISALIAFLITPDVRGWNRISLYIAFFSLLAVGLLLDHARPPDAGPRRRRLAGLLLMVVLVVGWLDETSTFFVVDYKASAREYQSDRAFGRLIQSRLPPGASVLELPYVPFPEGYHLAGSAPSTAFSTSYDLLRPYLSTDGLHWSFGAIKGRPSDWESALAAKRLDLVAAAAVAAGFQAIYVDPHGYNDPVLAHRVAVGLTELLGSPPLLSPRRDVWLFGLGRYRLRLERRAGPAALAALREATLRPLRTECATTPDVIVLSNPSRSPRPAVLTAALTAPLPGGVRIRITFPDGSTELRALDATVAHLHRRLLVVPGQSRVRIAIVGDFPFATSPFSPAFIVSVPTLVDDAFAPFRTRRRGLAAALPVAGLVGPTCNDLYQTSAASKLPSAYPQRPRPRAPAARPLH